MAFQTRDGVSGMSMCSTPSRTQRVEHGVHDRRRRADRAGFADALDAERIGLGRGSSISSEMTFGNVARPRHGIVEKASAQQADRSPDRKQMALAQRLPEALRDPAVDLPFADHRIDDQAEIVDSGEAGRWCTAPVSGSTSTSHTWQPLG